MAAAHVITAHATAATWFDQANQFLQRFVQDIPAGLESIGTWQAALVAIPVGIVFLLFGFRIYRFLASVIFAAIGLWVGLAVAVALDFNWILGMAVGALVLGLLGWFLVRMAWGLVCGSVGATVAALVWVHFFGLFESPIHGWLVGGAGFLAGSILGVLFFRLVVIAVTSLNGAAGIVWGALKLVSLVPSIGKPVIAALQQAPWLLLLAVLVPAIVGAMVQWNDTKSMPREPGKGAKPAKKGKGKGGEDE